jgi:hypothetical protein
VRVRVRVSEGHTRGGHTVVDIQTMTPTMMRQVKVRVRASESLTLVVALVWLHPVATPQLSHCCGHTGVVTGGWV